MWKSLPTRGLVFVTVAAIAGCGGGQNDPKEPEVNADTVPSMALLDDSDRPEDATASGNGPSCEDVIDEQRRKAEEQGAGEEPTEEHNESIKETLSSGAYLQSCEVPEAASIDVCAAIIGGVAQGVTVKVNPGDAPTAACIADAIRRLDFPAHELVSVARTEFSGH
jgi:hypothetical protein